MRGGAEMAKGGAYRKMESKDWRDLYEATLREKERLTVKVDYLSRALRDLRESINAALEHRR